MFTSLRFFYVRMPLIYSDFWRNKDIGTIDRNRIPSDAYVSFQINYAKYDAKKKRYEALLRTNFRTALKYRSIASFPECAA